MHYIKDIFEKKATQHAHEKFVRYSKGEFVGPLCDIRITATAVKINASFHYNDELLMLIADILKNNEIHVKGSVVWNKDLAPDLANQGIKYAKVTKARGIFKYVLDNDIKFKTFLDEFGKYNLLLSVKNDDLSLVTKPNFPKPNKEFSSDFCKATFPGSMAKKILSEFAFDVKETKIKRIIIKHKLNVTDIDVPKVESFEEARRLAKRIGTIEREVYVNGAEEPVKTNTDFNI